MIQKVDVPVSVSLVFDSRTRRVYPRRVLWDGRSYDLVKVGLHHTFRRGRTLYHVFSASSSTIFFRLVLNTDNLFWRLEEVADNEAS
ncbi:MAG: hypothetical protein WCT01_05055 [Candidatus Shapirobacteria bacterium]